MSAARSKAIYMCLFVGFALLMSAPRKALANIIIKVRALNPLESEETASIRYPLPPGITPDHILKKNIIYSLPKEEEEEASKTTFNIELSESEGRYYIVDEITMGPREVITLEAHVQDIWSIAQERFSGIKQTVETLIAQYLPTPADEEEQDEQQSLMRETAAALQEEIFTQIDEIAARQAKSTVLLAGVERHMEAYYENMEALARVENDVMILENLLIPEEEDTGEGEEGSPAQEESGGEQP